MWVEYRSETWGRFVFEEVDSDHLGFTNVSLYIMLHFFDLFVSNISTFPQHKHRRFLLAGEVRNLDVDFALEEDVEFVAYLSIVKHIFITWVLLILQLSTEEHNILRLKFPFFEELKLLNKRLQMAQVMFIAVKFVFLEDFDNSLQNYNYEILPVV